ETVALVKKHANPRAGAFANAILRKIVADKDNLPKINISDPDERLATKYSHPLWLVRKLTKQYGRDAAEQILAANNKEAPVYIRVNTIKTDTRTLIADLSREGISASPVDGVPDALLCVCERPLHLTDGFKNGLFYIQDLASQLAITLLDPKPEHKLIDMCSAPGGKSIAAAQLMQNKGLICAFDVHEHKINIIRQNAEKYGINIINAQVGDSTVPIPMLEQSADRIICDVPCSGLGIIRKKPDIRFKAEDSISSLPDIQYEILKNAASYVKPGGRLLYSTCTVIREENQDIISRFLDSHTDFKLAEFSSPITAKTPGYITLRPDIHNCDGFFIAIMDRKI
ncbi:MAG: 16S rRNA (cytosine(967)-C(5))-methyltransferase RsmB, partial [Clostridia bacterium]|nr:16S rRNA (cytosine(967)-C(5))-methyltransferase RsmB [Clostridia bacterium]